MAVYGMGESFAHPENGMIRSDMDATLAVAGALDEVIIFRSTGPWAKRWIARKYPTKNFHVKGKSSDWGPHAGFVPYDGTLSKAGWDTTKAGDSTKANDHGIADNFAGKSQLKLKTDELYLQLNQAECRPPRTALSAISPIKGSNNLVLKATRSKDGKLFTFLAVWDQRDAAFQIEVCPDGMKERSLFLGMRGTPLMVMTSSEGGAGNKPMTGDYDLMAVCPSWNDYGSTTDKTISKPGLVFNGKVQRGAGFVGPLYGTDTDGGRELTPGARLDRTLDPRLNTGAKGRLVPDGDKMKKVTFQGHAAATAFDEHGDMGNLTPRILRCMNALNVRMGAVGSDAPFRRVHHNAESHRNWIHGGLTGADMDHADPEKRDGVPFTSFQPPKLRASIRAPYQTDVVTLETLGEFKEYCAALHQAGYFVPRSWAWGMSIRDTANALFAGKTLKGR
jgi:hypothetical protein